MPFYNPLRYPNGKRRLISLIKCLLDENGLTDVRVHRTLCRGGIGSVGATYGGTHASTIHLNDLSRPIFAFWHSVLHRNQELCRGVESFSLTMERMVYAAGSL